MTGRKTIPDSRNIVVVGDVRGFANAATRDRDEVSVTRYERFRQCPGADYETAPSLATRGFAIAFACLQIRRV